jgi:hypothetical protein
MLINLYKKSTDIILQWLDSTAAIIIPLRRPVRIPITEPDNIQHYCANRAVHAVKRKPLHHE